jgi:hypothetical protein
VCFYEDVRSLSRTVAGFIGAGLMADQPAVVIATASHGAAIRDQLLAAATDSARRIQRGELIMLDADDLLNRFMVDDMPDTQRFEETIGPIMARAAGSRKRIVRAYGEMVDLLWIRNNPAAAISLEMLWNQLIATSKCSLLCGYSSTGVGHGDGFNRICDQHSHVVSQ